MSPLALRLAHQLTDTRHSETLLINEVSNRLAADNRPLYRFGFGQSPFPVPEHVVEALRSNAHRKEYLNAQGLPELRRAVADFHNQVDGSDWHPDQIIIGAGSKILLYCLMAAVKSADVALISPSWVSYEPQAKLAQHRVLRIKTRFEDRWRLTPEVLDQFCDMRDEPDRPLILVLNYPGNPDGETYSANALRDLADVMRRHHVYVISDEIYGLLHHKGEHVSLAQFYPEGTMVTSGLSKWCGAGGWRLGICHIPTQLGPDYLQRVIGVASETYSCVSTPVQLAALTAYTYDQRIHDFLQQQRAILSEIGNRCADMLEKGGVRVYRPEGGFYLFPDFSPFSESLVLRGIDTGNALTSRLLQDTGVALLPGSAFGMDENSLTARLAYVDFDGAQALRDEVADASHLYQGIEKLCAWLRA